MTCLVLRLPGRGGFDHRLEWVCIAVKVLMDLVAVPGLHCLKTLITKSLRLIFLVLCKVNKFIFADDEQLHIRRDFS